MIDLTHLYDLIGAWSPFACLEARFMQRAFLGLALLAPMAAALGVQVVNFRMAFFSDAIGHSAFAGIALGLILAVDPHWTMVVFGVVVGVAIMAMQRKSALSSDTVTGVVFSTVVAFGLAAVSRDRSVGRDMVRFLYGDVLTLADGDVLGLMLLFAALAAFQAYSYNRMLYIGFNPTLARTHRVRVAAYQYAFALLLSLVVMYAVRAVGVLLVTALLVVPAASARNFASSAGGMFWWALLVGLTSAVAGLVVSAQPWAATATGATVILAASCWFGVSAVVSALKGGRAFQ